MFKVNSVQRGHCGVKHKTVFTDCYTVCSKACLLMFEPMRRGEKGETDEVRAVSHASWPAQGTGVGGEGYAGGAGAGDSSHSDSSDGTQVLTLAWSERGSRWCRVAHVPSASDTLVGKLWNWQTIGRWTVCVNVCVLLSHPGFGSQPTQSTPLARHKTGSWHKRMGGLTVRGQRSQSRSQHRTHWRGRKFTSAITLLCLLWSHSEGDKVWSAPLKFRPRCLLRTMNKIINPLDTSVELLGFTVKMFSE